MEIWSQIGMSVAVLAALAGVLLWMSKHGMVSASGLSGLRGAAKQKELSIVDKVAVSAHHTLVLVDVNGARFLICLSPAGAHTTLLKGAD
jgi:flagellar biogenesis protein FliO